MGDIESISTIEIVGIVSKEVIDLLGISLNPNTEILIGPTNIKHMQDVHAEDFKKYSSELKNILSNPDYVVPHPKNGSLQYIKVIDSHVLIAVRVSKSGSLFARSIYSMTTEKVEKYRRKGLFEKYRLT